ncbi:MAG: mycothiol synthase [Actinomycetales bacterium]
MRTVDRLTADQADAVRALAETATSADGVAPLDEQTLLRLAPDSARSATHHLLEDDDGALLAYAQVAEGSGELVVAPPARRRGYGRELVRAARSGERVALWAHGDLPGARALAAAEGLTRVRELLRMGASVGSGENGGSDGSGGNGGGGAIPEPPDGVRIETFDVGRHAEPWLRVNARAFASHPEQGRMTRADLDERLAQDWFDPDLLLLAFDAGSGAGSGTGSSAAQGGDGEHVARSDGDPLAFIWMKPGDEGQAELYVLGVDPEAQGRGLGRALTARGLAEVAARGRTEVDLYVEGDNAPALATYERQGFGVVERHSQYA